MNSSTPSVFSTFGGMAVVATTIFMLQPPSAGWQLASLIAAIMTNVLAL